MTKFKNVQVEKVIWENDTEFTGSNKTFTMNTVTNPFPILSGTHSIKLQFS